LYTWQYYDLVDRVANPSLSKYAFWIRAAFVAAASFGTIIATLLYALNNALALWYTIPKNFDKHLISHYLSLGGEFLIITYCITGFCCLLSILLLGGTIFWVRSLTLEQNNDRIQAESLNLQMVILHIVLLSSQIALLYFA
jgi:hypothetical protein